MTVALPYLLGCRLLGNWMQIIGKDMIMGWAARKTNFPRVDAVIASVVQTHNWKEAASVSACHLYQISSAMNLNIFEPFTEEHAFELNLAASVL